MLLEEAHVQIFPEFEGDSGHYADLRKAILAVEAQRAFIVGRDDGDEIFYAALASQPFDLRIELLPDAAAAAGAVYIDRKIGGAAVGAAGVEHVEIGEADGLSRAVARDDVRIVLRDARRTRTEPAPPQA